MGDGLALFATLVLGNITIAAAGMYCLNRFMQLVGVRYQLRITSPTARTN